MNGYLRAPDDEIDSVDWKFCQRAWSHHSMVQTKLTSKIASISNLCRETSADDRCNHSTVSYIREWHEAMRTSTYKLLKPSRTDTPIFSLNAICRLYIMAAGMIVRAISVNVFVAPWKNPKSAWIAGLQHFPGWPTGSHKVANCGHWATIKMIVRMLMTACCTIRK